MFAATDDFSTDKNFSNQLIVEVIVDQLIRLYAHF